MKLTKWNGSLQQLLWFDGLAKSEKHKLFAALASRRYKLRWNAEKREGELVKIR